MIDPLLFDCAGRPLDLKRPAVMGILNITPDSFSDGGRFQPLDDALRQARLMAQQGAAILDVGGESTRPGADEVTVQQEMDRVLPVIERLLAELPLPISLDSSKPAVMAAALRLGVGMINDVNALRAPGALGLLAQVEVPICLMHMQGIPRSMQQNPHYQDVVAEVEAFLSERLSACQSAGIDPQRILLDPGFGFGKTLPHNLTLLARLQQLTLLGRPLLVGMSRKSMIGTLLGGVDSDQRLQGSVAAAVLAVERGARLLRVHDVKETVEALKIVQAVLEIEGVLDGT